MNPRRVSRALRDHALPQSRQGRATQRRVDHKAALGGTLLSSVSYEYDTQNRRIEKRADTDGNGTVDVSQKFVYNGMNLSQTTDAAGNTVEVFMSSPGADQFLANGTDWLLGDHQGTIRDRVSMATHADTHVQYNAFGEILGGAIGTSTATIGYTGQIWDAHAGLYNFRNRWYDPKIGKFLSQDPIGFTAGDANLYRYVGNSPLSFTDPTGLQAPTGGASGLTFQSDLGGVSGSGGSSRGGGSGGGSDFLHDRMMQGHQVPQGGDWRTRPSSSGSSTSSGASVGSSAASGSDYTGILSNDLRLEGTSGLTNSINLSIQGLELNGRQAIPTRQPSGYGNSWTSTGAEQAFLWQNRENEAALIAYYVATKEMGFSLEKVDYYNDDYGAPDFSNRTIPIDSGNWLLGDRTNENAAHQLYEVMYEHMPYLDGFDERTWSRIAWDVPVGLSKAALSVPGMMTGSALVAAPEPTMLTKIGGAGLFVASADFGGQGLSQIGGYRGSGGMSVAQESAGAYGQWMYGDIGEQEARQWTGIAMLLFNVQGGLQAAGSNTGNAQIFTKGGWANLGSGMSQDGKAIGQAASQLRSRYQAWRSGQISGPAHSSANAARFAENLHAAELANPAMENLRVTGQLPAHYVTKPQANASGWLPGKALNNSVPGGQLGGDVFRDPASIGLPMTSGRLWFEADIGLSNTMSRANQPGTRLLYSNDGKAFVTPNHYGRVYQIPDWR